MSERRCAFCGIHAAYPFLRRKLSWCDVGGRPVCGGECEALERARQAATPEERIIEVHEIDGVRRVDQVAWAAEHPPEDLERRVRERLNGGDIAVTTNLHSWSATWRRRYPVVGLSDQRTLDGATYADVLAAILSWEDEADTEDAERVAAVHGDSAGATVERR